jgi:CBS domain-containing protein
MTTKPSEIKTTNESSSNKSVKDYMTKNPEAISPKTTIKEAAKKMRDLNTGSLPVGNEEKLTGFVTDRDIVIKAVAQGLDFESTTIDKIMTDKVLYCYEDNELGAVVDNMKNNEVLRLIVVDENKQLKGVITHSQLAMAAMESDSDELFKKVTELACYDKIS